MRLVWLAWGMLLLGLLLTILGCFAVHMLLGLFVTAVILVVGGIIALIAVYDP